MNIAAYPIKSIGAISFQEGEPVDRVLKTIANELKSNGLTVRGFLQEETPDPKSCCSILDLINIENGNKTRISQSLGKGSKGCRLDPAGLAAATADLLSELNGKTDVVILNRFGKGESEGQGFRSIIEKAISENILVLLAVRQTYIQSFEEFAEGFIQYLPCDSEEIKEWCAKSASIPVNIGQ